MNKLTTEQIAWCAGVIDALGHIRLRETDVGSQLAMVSVSTALVPIAERLAELTGMKVTTVRRNYTRFGCTDHCTEPHLHVDSNTGRWSLTGSRANTFLLAVRPYLVVKADVVDEVLAATADAPRKPRTSEKMAQLGWPVRVTA